MGALSPIFKIKIGIPTFWHELAKYIISSIFDDIVWSFKQLQNVFLFIYYILKLYLVIYKPIRHEDINQKKKKKNWKVFGISKNNIICAKSRQGTYYFLKRKTKNLGEYSRIFSFLEMESSKLINKIIWQTYIGTNEHYRTRQGSTTMLYTNPSFFPSF
jgi:hypothetical protein